MPLKVRKLHSHALYPTHASDYGDGLHDAIELGHSQNAYRTFPHLRMS